jgi:Fe-S-cluster-containing hydrogenase component 2
VTGSSAFWDDVAPRVDPDLCRRCDECPAADACAARGFGRERKEGVPVVDSTLCYGCYSCVGACPQRAIKPPNWG